MTELRNHGFNIKVLFYLGSYFEPDTPSLSIIVYTMLGGFLSSFIMITVVLLTINLYKNMNNLNFVISVMYLLITLILVSYKILLFPRKRKELHKLLALLNNGYFKLRDEGEFSIYQKWNHFFAILTILLVILGAGTGLCMALGPLLLPQENRPLPVQIWTFVEINNTNYWHWYAFCLCQLLSGGVFVVCEDCFIYWLIWQIGIQYELILYRFYGLSSTLESIRPSASSSRVKYFEMKESTENSSINQVIKHQLQIYKYAEELEKFFRMTFAAHYLISALSICFTMFKYFFLKPESWIETASDVLFCISIVTEFFLFCYWLNEVTIQSQNFARKLYESNWISLSQTSKKKLIIIMTYSDSNKITLKGGPLFVLNLIAFMKIMKTAYSVFNILKEPQ